MAYELRPLVASDLGTICKIISKIGVKQFGERLDLNGINKKDVEKLGLSIAIEGAGIIIENMACAEKDIHEFLASLTGMKVAEVQKMPFADYGELILSVVMKEEFSDFFARAMKLFNR